MIILTPGEERMQLYMGAFEARRHTLNTDMEVFKSMTLQSFLFISEDGSR